MNRSFLLGVDVGTSMMKSILIDSNGHILYETIYPYSLEHPKPLWSEQDPNDWWVGLKETIKRVLRQVPAEDIVGIGIDCACPTLVPVNKEGGHLDKAIIYNDRRSINQAEWIKEKIGEERVFETTGNRIAPGAFSATSILWLKQNKPNKYKSTKVFLHANGYLIFKLTDQATMDWTNASFTLLFDIYKKKWSYELCDQMNVTIDKLPQLHPSWEIVGEITARAAEEVKLAAGTPIIAGGADTPCAAVGVGAQKIGNAIDSSGTSTVLGVCIDKPIIDRRLMIRCHAVPDQYMYIAPSNLTGGSLQWFRECLECLENRSRERSKNVSYEWMDREAERSEPGAKGVVFLPYLAGERAPIWDSDAKGILCGLTLNHTRSDVIRAILEGGAFALRHNMEVIEKLGVQINVLKAIGGQSRSKLWCRIKADVTGKKVIRSTITEAAAFGAAILAGVGAGVYKNTVDVTDNIVSEGDEIIPASNLYERYSYLFEVYKKAYDPQLMKQLSKYHSLFPS